MKFDIFMQKLLIISGMTAPLTSWFSSLFYLYILFLYLYKHLGYRRMAVDGHLLSKRSGILKFRKLWKYFQK